MGGQGRAIAENLWERMGLTVPVLSVIIGEGGSGGALALACANQVYMLENAIYSVLSPEGAASIIYKDAGKVEEAERLANAKLVCKGAGSGLGNGTYDPYGSYQALGDLRLVFASDVNAENYQRTLDLSTGILRVAYTLGTTTYEREYFISAPDKVLLIRMTASGPDTLDFEATLDRDPKSGSHRWKNDGRLEPFTDTEETVPPVHAIIA